MTAYGTINSGELLTGSSSRPAGILAGYRGGTTNTINAAVYGNVTVDNFANINAAGGDGIRAYNFGNGDVTVNDHAGTTITTKDQFGIDAQTNGTGQVTVTTAAGDIITSGSYGIQAINLATAVPLGATSSVSVTAQGTIHAGFHLSPGAGQNQGISAGYFPNNGTSDINVNGTVSIDNFANVTSDNGWGVNAYNWGNGSVTLTDEAGTSVSGMQYGLSGFSGSTGAGSSGSVTINVLANATITAGAAINAAGINANERNAGNITITMSTGDTINSGGYGINAGNQATSASFVEPDFHYRARRHQFRLQRVFGSRNQCGLQWRIERGQYRRRRQRLRRRFRDHQRSFRLRHQPLQFWHRKSQRDSRGGCGGRWCDSRRECLCAGRRQCHDRQQRLGDGCDR